MLNFDLRFALYVALSSAIWLAGCSDKEGKGMEGTSVPKSEAAFQDETRKIASQFKQQSEPKCIANNAQMLTEFDKLYARKQFDPAADLVRECANARGGEFRELLKKAEIAGFETVINDSRGSAYSRLASLNAYERAYPEQVQKYVALRHHLVESNANEMRKEESRAANGRKSQQELSGVVNPNAPAQEWRTSRGSERLDYAVMASVMCQSRNCGAGQIKACIDEVTRPPTPPGLSSMTIGELAINCIKILKSQQ